MHDEKLTERANNMSPRSKLTTSVYIPKYIMLGSRPKAASVATR